MGLHLARILDRRLTGRRARVASVRYVWINISLGRHDGVTSSPGPMTARADSS